MPVLSAALHLAVANEIISSIPKFPRRLRPAPPRQGFLEHEDYVAIRAQLPDWGIPILDFAYYSGWRRNEILALTRHEIDLDLHLVRLDPARSKNGDGRTIPLLDFGLKAIETALAQSNTNGLVFTRRGCSIRASTWHMVWKRATTAAGRPHLHFHDLRRTVVRRLELRAVSRKLAMAWVGHRTQCMYERYCITQERDLVSVAAKMLSGIGAETSADKVVSIFRNRA